MNEEDLRLPVENPGQMETGFPYLDAGSFPTKNEILEVLSLSGKERLAKILNCQDPAELVAQIPEMDLFLTLKELGLKEAGDLIGLATPEQTIHFLDLDLWRKDRLDPDHIRQWLEVLEACGEEKLRQFLETVDPELLVSIFQKLIRVKREEDRQEDQGKKPEITGFTLDRLYYVEFLQEKDRPLLTKILTYLNSYDSTFYQNFLEGLFWMIPAEEEETALQWRKGRLADRGFPDFFEAQAIYRYRPPERLPDEEITPEPLKESPFHPPGYLAVIGRGSFLYRVLGLGVREELTDRIQWEVMQLANQILVAGGTDPGEPGAVFESTGRAFQTLDLGLKHLSGEDPVKAARVLERFSILRIFQNGFSLGLELKYRAESMFRKGGWYGSLEGREKVLDSPFKEIIGGLLFKRPLYYDPETAGNYRPFLTLQELRDTGEILNNLEMLAALLFGRLGVSAEEVNRLRRCPLHHPDPTLTAVFLTILTQGVLTGKFGIQPLSVQDLERVRRLLLEPGPGGPPERIKTEIISTWREALRAGGRSLSPEGEEALGGWLRLVAGRLEEEISRVPSVQGLDPRFISMLLIEK